MKDHYPWRTWLDHRGIRHAIMRGAEGGAMDMPKVAEHCGGSWFNKDGEEQSDPEVLPTCSACRAAMAKWHEDAELIRRSLWLRGCTKAVEE